MLTLKCYQVRWSETEIILSEEDFGFVTTPEAISFVTVSSNVYGIHFPQISLLVRYLRLCLIH